MPSVEAEGLPRGIMEAMASGRACCRNGGFKRIRGLCETLSTVFLVPTADVNALADALGRLARDSDLIVKMGARCYQHAGGCSHCSACSARS